VAAKRSKIAELVVGFVVEGAKGALSTVKQAVGHVATAAKWVAGVGAAVQGGIIAKALQGTQEAHELGQAFEYLVRVVGQSFAPYVRMLTTLLAALAGWFRSLSPETQRWIAVVGIAAVAIAALIALAPTIAAAWSAAGAVIGAVWAGVAAVIGFVFSPIGLITLAVVGLIAAFAALFVYLTGGWSDVANSTNDANKSWVEKAIDWIQAVAKAFGQGFNWIMRQAAKTSDWIAEKLADAGEYLGILPEGTGKAVREMPPIEPFQLDLTKIDLFFKKVKGGVNAVAPAVKGLWGTLSDLFGELMNPSNPKGFTLRMKVELEGLQGTYDRLLKAFAEGDGEDIQKQILEQNKEFNQKLDRVREALVGGFNKVAGELGMGVVGP
jgi:hypothetical protein